MKKPLTILSLSLGAMSLGAPAAAQTTPAPPAITRTVIAATKLSTQSSALHSQIFSGIRSRSPQ
jgi:hypothetical protein